MTDNVRIFGDNSGDAFELQQTADSRGGRAVFAAAARICAITALLAALVFAFGSDETYFTAAVSNAVSNASSDNAPGVSAYTPGVSAYTPGVSAYAAAETPQRAAPVISPKKKGAAKTNGTAAIVAATKKSLAIKSAIRPDMDTAQALLNGVAPAIELFSGSAPSIELFSGNSPAIGLFSAARQSDEPEIGLFPAAARQPDALRDTPYPEAIPYAPIRTVFYDLCDISAEVAREHQTLLDKRADSLSYARQLAAAKFLSQSAYNIEMAWREDFIAKNGKSAGELTDDDIAKMYNNEYFIGRLRDLGFFREDTYGADVNRRNAIIRAQSWFNIPITAKIDLDTKRALIEGSDYVPRDVITGAHPDGMWVVIDKSARILTVYIDTDVLFKFPVAVGANIALTPEGQHTFVSKAVNPRWGGGGYAAPVAGGAPGNPLGKRWMGLSVGGGGSYGVHGNVSANSIGTNASHGCVRMINSDVEFLYDYIQIGTPIWIGTTSKLAEWGIYQQLGCWPPDPPDYRDYLPQPPESPYAPETEQPSESSFAPDGSEQI